MPSANGSRARKPSRSAARSAPAKTWRTSPRRYCPVVTGAGAPPVLAACKATAISPMLRDFIHVRDVARANVLALTAPTTVPGAFNVASGTPRSIGEMASALHAASTRGAPAPLTTGEYRLGDVRHVFAGADLAAERLGFRAQEPFRAGMAEFAAAALRAPPR